MFIIMDDNKYKEKGDANEFKRLSKQNKTKF